MDSVKWFCLINTQFLALYIGEAFYQKNLIHWEIRSLSDIPQAPKIKGQAVCLLRLHIPRDTLPTATCGTNMEYKILVLICMD